MSVIIDPRTGALVSDLRDQVEVDALVRVFTPLQSRAQYPGFGTNLFDAMNNATPEALAGLRARITAACRNSPYYELTDVAVLHDGEVLDLCLSLDLIDGSSATLPIATS